MELNSLRLGFPQKDFAIPSFHLFCLPSSSHTPTWLVSIRDLEWDISFIPLPCAKFYLQFSKGYNMKSKDEKVSKIVVKIFIILKVWTCYSLSHVQLFADSIDCSLPDSSVHGILQTIIMEWIAIPFSRGSSQPRDWIWVSCIAGRLFTIWAIRDILIICKAIK